MRVTFLLIFDFDLDPRPRLFKGTVGVACVCVCVDTRVCKRTYNGQKPEAEDASLGNLASILTSRVTLGK